MAETDIEKKILINKIYVKDLSFESPKAPVIFSTDLDWNPSIKLDMSWASNRLSEGTFETVLKITLSAELEQGLAYLMEIQQAGTFSFTGYDNEETKLLLSTYCPNILFPYVREAISDVVGKGGFPPIILKPINFDKTYLEQTGNLRTDTGSE